MSQSTQPTIENFRDDYIAMANRVKELERQLADAINGKLPEDQRLDPSLILVSSMVTSHGHEPAVSVRWFTHVSQMTPATARDLALNLMRNADAAESDAFVINFFRTQLQITEPLALGGLMQAFRDFREGQESQEAERNG